MIDRAARAVKTYFTEPRAEGGGVRPQWLMGRSPVWQTVSSTHWQRPPDLDLPYWKLMEELVPVCDL
jgi:hypothetical protein